MTATLYIAILSALLLWTQSDASIEAVVPGLRQKARAARENLPNIVCDERMEWNDGVAESEFTVIRRQAPMGSTLVESRRAKSINGQPVTSTLKPFRSATAASFSLSVLLVDNFNFEPVGQHLLDGTNALILRFETKTNVREHTKLDSSGKVWVDVTTLRVLRLEDQTRFEGRTIRTSVNYQAVKIDEKLLLAPERIESKLIEGRPSDSSYVVDYVAEYTNCRKPLVPPVDEIIKPSPGIP